MSRKGGQRDKETSKDIDAARIEMCIRDRTTASNGWMSLLIVIVFLAIALVCLLGGAENRSVLLLVLGVALGFGSFVMVSGFFTLQPNEAVDVYKRQSPARPCLLCKFDLHPPICGSVGGIPGKAGVRRRQGASGCRA